MTSIPKGILSGAAGSPFPTPTGMHPMSPTIPEMRTVPGSTPDSAQTPIPGTVGMTPSAPAAIPDPINPVSSARADSGRSATLQRGGEW